MDDTLQAQSNCMDGKPYPRWLMHGWGSQPANTQKLLASVGGSRPLCVPTPGQPGISINNTPQGSRDIVDI